MPERLFDRIVGYGSIVAIIQNNKKHTYLELSEKISEKRRYLKSIHCQKCNVCLISDYSFESISYLIALWLEGNIVALIASSVEISKVDDLIAINKPAYVLNSNGSTTKLLKLNNGENHYLINNLITLNESGYVIFSSGSSGIPKAAVHQTSLLIEKHSLKGRALITISFLLFDHIGGLNTLLRNLMNGGTLAIPPDRRCSTISKMIEKFNVQALVTTPTFLNLLFLSKSFDLHDFNSLDNINYGTEPMPLQLLEKIRERLPNTKLSQAYGLTETGVVPIKSISSDSNRFIIDDSICQYRVVNGLLEIKTNTTMLGYLNSESQTTNDGYFKTGDVVVVENNSIQIIGRKSELINIGGEKFYPAEIEHVLLKMDGVIDVAVTKKPNLILGQIISAQIQVDKLIPENEFRKLFLLFCKKNLSKSRTPQQLFQTLEPLHNYRFKKIRK